MLWSTPSSNAIAADLARTVERLVVIHSQGTNGAIRHRRLLARFPGGGSHPLRPPPFLHRANQALASGHAVPSSAQHPMNEKLPLSKPICTFMLKGHRLAFFEQDQLRSMSRVGAAEDPFLGARLPRASLLIMSEVAPTARGRPRIMTSLETLSFRD